MTPRRAILAAPALLLPGCTPEAPRPATGGDGATTPAAAVGGDRFPPWTGWTPTPQELWALVPSQVQRRLAEDPVFADAPLPGLDRYEDPLLSDPGVMFEHGRIGPLNWSILRARRSGRAAKAASSELTIGGLGSGSTTTLRIADTSPSSLFQDTPGASISFWREILSTEGRLFPLREGQSSRVVARQAILSARSDGYINSQTIQFDVVRRMRPWEAWRALVLGEYYLWLSSVPDDFLAFSAFLAGDVIDLAVSDPNWPTRGSKILLYSELLATGIAEGARGEGGDAASIGRMTMSLGLLGAASSPGTMLSTFRLTPAGQARLAQAQAAERAEIDAMAMRSQRLAGADRARATEAFRTAFGLWQAENFRAAFLGFTAGLAVDPGNGIAHYYAGASARSMFPNSAPPREGPRSSGLRRIATERLHRFHMTAAARFAPTTREGMEAAGLVRS